MTAITSDFSETLFFPEIFNDAVEKPKKEAQEIKWALITQLALNALAVGAAVIPFVFGAVSTALAPGVLLCGLILS